MKDTAALLDATRDLMAQRQPNIEVILKIIDDFPLEKLDVPARSAVVYARHVAAGSQGKNSAHTVVVRYALARIVRLIEQHVEVSVL